MVSRLTIASVAHYLNVDVMSDALEVHKNDIMDHS
jgi:hypothetical protein